MRRENRLIASHMMAIAAMVGVGFPLGQVQKKAQKTARFAQAGDVERARRFAAGASGPGGGNHGT